MQKPLRLPALLLAVFLLFPCTGIFAADAPAPQLAHTLSALVKAQGTITATGGTVQSLSLNVSVPSTTTYQVVQAGEQVKFDSEGNGYLSISAQNPPNPFTYSKPITVRTTVRTTPSLPESYSMPSSYSLFLSATNRTQSGDASIRALAQQITANARTPFEKVALLAIYVNRNMEYEIGMVGQQKDALWVNANLRGVCTEYSTLFTALARSIGIPTRYVSGYVYSDKFGSWMGHSWAEAYVGEWVPVDPTWFEVGSLDAMHIEESKYAEFSHRDTLSAAVSKNGVKIVWDTGEKSGAIAGNIDTLDVDYLEPLGGFELDAAETELAIGGRTIAYLAMNGTDYRVIPLSLANCAGTASVSLDEGEKYLILEPGRASTIAWEINASSSLSKDYIYACPLTLNSPYLERRTLTIEVNPTISAPPMFEASLRDGNILVGGNNSVFLKVSNQVRGGSFSVVLPDGVYTAKADGGSAEIPFASQAFGRVPVYVAGEGGGAVRLAYTASRFPSGLSISSFFLPESLVAGKQAIARANISALHYPADISLAFTFGSQSMRSVGKLSAPTSFEFPFTPNASGTYSVSLVASSGGSQDEKSRMSTVLLQPVLLIEGVENIYSNGTLYTQVIFTKAGSPITPTASVGGSAYSAAGPITLQLPLGKHNVSLSWSDAAGNRYSSSEEITVSQPSIFSAATSPQGCPLAIILISAAALFAAAKR